MYHRAARLLTGIGRNKDPIVGDTPRRLLIFTPVQKLEHNIKYKIPIKNCVRTYPVTMNNLVYKLVPESLDPLLADRFTAWWISGWTIRRQISMPTLVRRHLLFQVIAYILSRDPSVQAANTSRTTFEHFYSRLQNSRQKQWRVLTLMLLMVQHWSQSINKRKRHCATLRAYFRKLLTYATYTPAKPQFTVARQRRPTAANSLYGWRTSVLLVLW